jgi:hypothetical protein
MSGHAAAPSPVMKSRRILSLAFDGREPIARGCKGTGSQRQLMFAAMHESGGGPHRRCRPAGAAAGFWGTAAVVEAQFVNLEIVL